MGLPERIPEDDATVLGGLTAVRSAGSSSPSAAEVSMAAPVLAPGTVLAERYEILQLLGQGGMGAVYKARDLELDRLVALKTIRREMAGSAAMLARFKQEIILARQITHRNVIRLYDIGEAGGTKFITMEYVEGEDLRTLLQRQNRLPQAETIDIIQQVCRALEAAHAEGVIHRDLKPGNIMRDAHGRVVVMDFGLARSLGLDGLTQTGALVGTLDYMSPEQALGGDIDTRSDLFAVGLIFFELLTGKVPYKADTSIASLLKRSQERASRASEVDASVPPVLSDIVSKCLEREQSQRYQSAAEILRDLDKFQNGSVVRIAAVEHAGLRFRGKLIYGAGAATLAIALAVAGIVLKQKGSPPASVQSQAQGPALALAVLPLRNASGDASVDWIGSTLAEMLSTDIGQSAQVRTVSSDRMHQVLLDLRIMPQANLDGATLRRLASLSNADVIVWGQYAKLGERMRLDLTLQDFKNDRTVPIKLEAGNENDLLATADKVAQSIRSNLALRSEVAQQLQATAFKPSTSSIPALRAYNEGLEYLRQGKNPEAQKAFQASVGNDPQFALAYSKLAQAYSNLGYDDPAEQASRKAMELSQSLPAAEKYQIVADNGRITKEYPKAIEAYQKLASIMPEDTDVQLGLARVYEETRATDKAREYYEKLLARDPKNVDALVGIGRLGIYRGEPQTSVDHLNRALALAVQFDNDEQRATALHFLGVAYWMLNKPNDALRNLGESLDIEQRRNDRGATARTRNAMAQVQQSLGRSAEALKNYQEVLRLRREIGDRRGIGSTLLDLGVLYESRGQYDEALAFTKQALQIEREISDPMNQATCLNNIGWLYLDKGDYENATTYFQQALDIREKLQDQAGIADTVYNLADTASKMGQYDEAIKYFVRALELGRKANDERNLGLASYGIGVLFGYQGRYGAAVRSEEDALTHFRHSKEQGRWLAQIQGGYGNALALAGRDAEAGKNLDEALALARQVNNGALTARLLNHQGDRLFYRADYKGARTQFEQALASAKRAKDPETILLSKFNLAKVSVKEGRGREVLNSLKTLAEEADRSGLKYLSAECSTYQAEALLTLGNDRRAREELDRSVRISDKLNLRALQARNHHLLATVLRREGNEKEASRENSEARRLLDDIRQESGSNEIVNRSDLAEINAAAK